jgi:hypothetical protein
MDQRLHNLIYGRIKTITSTMIGEANTPNLLKKLKQDLYNDAILKKCRIPWDIFQDPNDPTSIIINWK